MLQDYSSHQYFFNSKACRSQTNIGDAPRSSAETRQFTQDYNNEENNDSSIVMTEKLWLVTSVLALVLGILVGILSMLIRRNICKG